MESEKLSCTFDLFVSRSKYTEMEGILFNADKNVSETLALDFSIFSSLSSAYSDIPSPQSRKKLLFFAESLTIPWVCLCDNCFHVIWQLKIAG